MVRVGLAQMSMTGKPDENLARCIEYLEQAVKEGVQLLCFPELQFSPFFPQYPRKDAAQYLMSLSDPIFIRFRAAASAAKLVTIANLYLQAINGKFDASPVFDADGTLLGISKMVHIVQLPRFYEQDYYTPSDDGFKVYDSSVGKVGVVICFDRHFPESIRSCALLGAELIVIPTAVIDDEPVEDFIWEMRVAAMHNRVFIAMCNRTGPEGEVRFCGRSFIIGPEGECLSEAGSGEELLVANIDLGRVAAAKQHPYFQLRRPEKYVYDLKEPKTN